MRFVQTLGPLFAVLVAPVGIAAIYIVSLRGDLAATKQNMVAIAESRDNWHRLYDAAVARAAACGQSEAPAAP